MRSVTPALLPAILSLALAAPWADRAAAQDAAPVFLKDIGAGTQASSPSSFAEVAGTVYFAGIGNVGTASIGGELWKTDGTAAGTVLVKDINPGSTGSDPALLTRVGSSLFFRANGGTSVGAELFRSDGTAAGIVLVRDVNPGANGSSIGNLVDFGGVLFFAANDGVNGMALWRSDGTAAGTVMVRDIRAGTADPAIALMTVVGSTLFFVANDGVNGVELWKTDGTTAGTLLVKDLNPGTGNSTPYGLRSLNGTLTFGGYTPATGSELWRSDGSAAGTVLVKDINPGTPNAGPVNFVVVGTTLYFSADNGAIGAELWRSDGTTGNTVMVKDINPGTPGSGPVNLTAVGPSVFFRATDGVTGLELWRSDGTTGGTVLVSDLAPGPSGSVLGPLAGSDTRLYFGNGSDPTFGTELWSSDGTAGGTALVRDLYPGAGGAGPINFLVVGSTLYFNAVDPLAGREPFTSDGTAAGTGLLKDANTLTLGSTPASLTNLRGTLYFAAFQRSSGTELWKSDGTPAGTTLVRDIEPLLGSSSPQSLTDLNGTLLFTATTAAAGRELWRSDGSAGGTTLVRDILPGSDGSAPTALVAIGSRVYFAATDDATGTELWASDGTAGGTVLLKDISPGTASSTPANLVNVQGTLFFTVGEKLWKSDGTTAGTVAVFDLTSAGSTGFARLTDVGGRLFFTTTATAGALPELWTSDTANQRVGASGATRRLRQFANGTQPRFLTDVNGTLFFAASDNPGAGLTGQELWKSDGTVGGTVLVKDVAPGTGSSNVFWIVNANGLVLFAANDGVNGAELWRSDGTTAGTTLVKDIAPGADASVPALLTAVNDAVFFTASRPTEGIELWRTDGTPAGTVLVADLAPGAASSSPQSLANVNGTLFFTADDQSTGSELYKMAIGVPQPAVAGLGPQFVGGQNTVFGAKFTPGAVVKYFVATAAGPVAAGPFTPSSYRPNALGVFLPPDVSLGNGFAAVQVINTDAGFRESNVSPALLFGDPADNIPSIVSINGTALPPADLAIGVAHVDTVVAKGSAVTIAGAGFNAPVVNVFTAAGNIGPLPALPGGTATQFQVAIPAGAPTGPGNFQVVNTVGFKVSNAVSSVLGAAPTITSVTAAGTTVTVNGTGFCSLSVINLFNLQGGAAVNLGGLEGGGAKVPLTIVSDTQFTFQRPAGAVTGPAFVEVLNPPFIPFASSGDAPDGAFKFPAPSPAVLTFARPGGTPGAGPAGAGDGLDSMAANEQGEGNVAGRGMRTERVVWSRPAGGATIAGDTLTATTNASPATGRGGARSTRALLRGDGALGWRVGGEGDATVGFGRPDGDTSGAGIEFGLTVSGATRDLIVTEGGVERVRLGRYEPGDRLRISVRGGLVEYWRNGVLLWTSTAAPRYPLVAGASLGRGALVERARIAGTLGTTVDWRGGDGARVASARAAADRHISLYTDDDAGAVEAGLSGEAAVGLESAHAPGITYRLARHGDTVAAYHAGTYRGTWRLHPDERVRVARDAGGTIRYSAGDRLLDIAPAVTDGPLRAVGWLPGAGSAIGHATMETP
jgi:ELWxxDGT repeat protein